MTRIPYIRVFWLLLLVCLISAISSTRHYLTSPHPIAPVPTYLTHISSKPTKTPTKAIVTTTSDAASWVTTTGSIPTPPNLLPDAQDAVASFFWDTTEWPDLTLTPTQQQFKDLIEHKSGLIKTIPRPDWFPLTGFSDFKRFSSPFYPSSQRFSLYSFCVDRVANKLNQGDVYSLSWSGNPLCALISNDSRTQANTLLFIGPWPQQRLDRAPFVTYNYANTPVIETDTQTSDSFILLQQNLLNQTSVSSAWGPTSWNTPKLQADGTYLTVSCDTKACLLAHPMTLDYHTRYTHPSTSPEASLDATFSIPYYKLEDDLFDFTMSKDFVTHYTAKVPNAQTHLTDSESEALQDSTFRVTLSLTHDKKFLRSGAILTLNDGNPKNISFDYELAQNAGHPYLRAIRIKSPKHSGYLIYDLTALQASWLENKGPFQWRTSENQGRRWGKKIDTTSLDRQDSITLE